MRKLITAAVIIAVAAITTAWTVSNPGITNKTAISIGSGSTAPMRTPALW